MKNRETVRLQEMVGTLGIMLKDTNTPIYDDKNNVVGCIAVGVSLDQETKVVSVARNINEAVENMDASIREFAESAENIKSSEKILRDNIDGVAELTKEIGKVLTFTKRITDQTNLLGLNASIEAARAGAHGAGFGVVADEISKTKSKITELKGISGKLEEITKEL